MSHEAYIYEIYAEEESYDRQVFAEDGTPLDDVEKVVVRKKDEEMYADRSDSDGNITKHYFTRIPVPVKSYEKSVTICDIDGNEETVISKKHTQPSQLTGVDICDCDVDEINKWAEHLKAKIQKNYPDKILKHVVVEHE